RAPPHAMVARSRLDADPSPVGGAAAGPGERSIGGPAAGYDQMAVAIELNEPSARRPRLVADHRPPALHAHGRIRAVEREREGLDAWRIERDDLRAVEPGAQTGTEGRVHGLDDDTCSGWASGRGVRRRTAAVYGSMR